MAENVIVKRPLVSFFLFFLIFLAIRMAFKWSEFKAEGRATLIGSIVYALGFSLLMVFAPRFIRRRTRTKS